MTEALFVVFVAAPYCEWLNWCEGLGFVLLRAVIQSSLRVSRSETDS